MSDDIVEWLQDNGAVENDGRISVPPEWFDKAHQVRPLRELIKRLKLAPKAPAKPTHPKIEASNKPSRKSAG